MTAPETGPNQPSAPPADERGLVERYLAAMQRGPEALDDLAALFAQDAVYVEPFSGRLPHRGREAIRAYLEASLVDRPPDLTVTVERMDLSPGRAETHWRCDSPAFTRPARGRDLLDVADGQIQRLHTIVLEPPTLAATAPFDPDNTEDA